MSDLPHVVAGYIQAEETDFRRATDRVVYKKKGSDQNWLKDQRDTIDLASIALFAQTTQGFTGATNFATDVNGNFQGPIFSTPNGKPILMAWIRAGIFSHGNAWPLPIFGGVPLQMALVSGNGSSTTDTGNFPLVGGQFVDSVMSKPNDTLYAQIVNGNSGSGMKTFPTWPGGTNGFLWYCVIYPT